MTDEFGIVYESNRERLNGSYGWRKAIDPWLTPGGIAVFATRDDREIAIAVLQELGYRYMVAYQDIQGPGLSWAQRYGGLSAVRPSARERLPSYRRGQQEEAARRRFQASLYKNVHYDLVNL